MYFQTYTNQRTSGAVLIFVFVLGGLADGAPKPYLEESWNTADRNGCYDISCRRTNYGTLGHRNNLASASSVKATAGAYSNSDGAGASASAHVAHATGRAADGWVAGEVNALKVGAGADIGSHGGSIGVDATLGEAGGKVGKGALSVGGKVGLSASTGIDISARRTGIKVIGTGVSFGSEDGLEFCFFGSCISIG